MVAMHSLTADSVTIADFIRTFSGNLPQALEGFLPPLLPSLSTIGALIIRIGFWGPYKCNKEPPKIVWVTIKAPILRSVLVFRRCRSGLHRHNNKLVSSERNLCKFFLPDKDKAGSRHAPRELTSVIRNLKTCTRSCLRILLQCKSTLVELFQPLNLGLSSSSSQLNRIRAWVQQRSIRVYQFVGGTEVLRKPA